MNLSSRKRDAPTTRAAILTAARISFAELGFDRTTVRAVALAAGCDHTLVYRYFGNKKELFVQAVSIEMELPDLASQPRPLVVPALLQHFFKVWEDDGTFIGLLRASAHSEEAVEAMRLFFTRSVMPRLSALVGRDANHRAPLAGCLIVGLAWARYILKNPPLSTMSRDDLVHLVTPMLEVALFGD